MTIKIDESKLAVNYAWLDGQIEAMEKLVARLRQDNEDFCTPCMEFRYNELVERMQTIETVIGVDNG